MPSPCSARIASCFICATNCNSLTVRSVTILCLEMRCCLEINFIFHDPARFFLTITNFVMSFMKLCFSCCSKVYSSLDVTLYCIIDVTLYCNNILYRCYTLIIHCYKIWYYARLMLSYFIRAWIDYHYCSRVLYHRDDQTSLTYSAWEWDVRGSLWHLKCINYRDWINWHCHFESGLWCHAHISITWVVGISYHWGTQTFSWNVIDFANFSEISVVSRVCITLKK